MEDTTYRSQYSLTEAINKELERRKNMTPEQRAKQQQDKEFAVVAVRVRRDFERLQINFNAMIDSMPEDDKRGLDYRKKQIIACVVAFRKSMEQVQKNFISRYSFDIVNKLQDIIDASTPPTSKWVTLFKREDFITRMQTTISNIEQEVNRNFGNK